MTATTKYCLTLALSAMCIAGCAPVSPGNDRWTYSGRDEALRAPPRIPRGELSAAAWMAQMQISQAEWAQRREERVERDKDACARETGDSKIPGYWFGFSNAFRACMLARGWSVGSNPL